MTVSPSARVLRNTTGTLLSRTRRATSIPSTFARTTSSKTKSGVSLPMRARASSPSMHSVTWKPAFRRPRLKDTRIESSPSTRRSLSEDNRSHLPLCALGWGLSQIKYPRRSSSPSASPPAASAVIRFGQCRPSRSKQAACRENLPGRRFP